MLSQGGAVRQGVEFWCTDVDEVVSDRKTARALGLGLVTGWGLVRLAHGSWPSTNHESRLILQDGAFSYQYQLRPGVNRQSHAIVSAHLTGLHTPPHPTPTSRPTAKLNECFGPR